MRQKSLFTVGIVALIFLAACNMPGGQDPGAVFTAAAETVNAQFTANAQLTPSSTNTPLPSATLAPSNTPAVSNTPFVASTSSGGASGCDAMGFVSDVTVPDGSDFAPDAEFTKTWRLRNTGTCSWSTSYALVFSSGNSMSGPASQGLPSSVAPNATIDVSVDLKAPSSQGTYTGYWALRNASGQNFGSFYVIIDVTSGGSSSSSGTTVTIHGDEVGSVRSNGATNPNPNTGDIDAATSSQAFVSFDISGIPSNATITEVEVDFTDFDMLGTPFNDLACLRAYAGNFFPLDAADYAVGPLGAYLRWCDDNELATVFSDDDMKDLLQSVVGDPTLQLRLQFNEHATDGDATADMVRFGTFTLNVTYTTP